MATHTYLPGSILQNTVRSAHPCNVHVRVGEVRDAGRIGVVEGGKGSRHLSYPVISKALQDRGTLTLNLTEPFLVTTMSQLLYPKPKPKPNPNPNPNPIQGIWARGTWHIDIHQNQIIFAVFPLPL